jgi:ABC-2 type transport system permease protein
MNFRHVYAIALRQYFLIWSNPTRFVQYFLWAAIDIILWGFITKYFAGIGGAVFALAPALLGGVVLWNFLIRTMQGISTSFFEDVWSRNFLNFFASPLSMGEYILGLVSTSIVTTSFSFMMMIILVSVFFGFSIFSFGLPLIAFMLVLFLFGVALGILAVGMVLRLGPAAEWFVWPIPAMLSPFVGVFYPISTLPYWMQVVGKGLPPTYVFEGMRALILHGATSLPDLFVGGALSLAYIILMYAFFKSVYQHAIRSGLIARYSAETSS